MASITQLEYIVSVDEHKNFSRASIDCGVSQPSLSAQILKLEEELDLIIFDRSKKPVLTTKEGLVVIKQAKSVLKEHRKLLDIKKNQTELEDDFHLAVIPSLAPYVVPLFIEQFSEKYPKVNLKISEFKTEDIVRQLYDDKVDGGLMVTPLKDNRIIERVLFYEKFFVFAAKNHQLSQKKMVKDSDLDIQFGCWRKDTVFGIK